MVSRVLFDGMISFKWIVQELIIFEWSVIQGALRESCQLPQQGFPKTVQLPTASARLHWKRAAVSCHGKASRKLGSCQLPQQGFTQAEQLPAATARFHKNWAAGSCSVLVKPCCGTKVSLKLSSCQLPQQGASCHSKVSLKLSSYQLPQEGFTKAEQLPAAAARFH